MDDLNIEISDKGKDNNKFQLDLCDTFSLQNIIIRENCHKCNIVTSVDIMPTRRPIILYKSDISETGISNHHKMIPSFFCSYFIVIPPTTI